MKHQVITTAIAIALSTNVFAKDANCKINVNKASAPEIQGCLDGFGEKKAELLIKMRPFTTIEDIKRVSGVGEKTFEKIKGKVCIDDACVSGGTPTQANPANPK